MSNFGKQALVDEMFVFLRQEGITISRDTTSALYDFIFAVMCRQINDGDTITLGKLGSLKAVDAAPRKGYVPATQERVHIPAMRRPKFNASSAFTTAINTDGVIRKVVRKRKS